MDVTAAILRAASWQQRIMTDTVRLEVADGETIDDLGTAITHWAVAYEGQGLVQARTIAAQQVDSAGRPVVVTAFTGKLPLTVQPQQARRCRLHVTASHDPGLVGIYEIESWEAQGLATCRRLALRRA